jgi:hypothetical protein
MLADHQLNFNYCIKYVNAQICPRSNPQTLVSKKEAAKKLNVSERSVKRATAVKKADPALFAEVKKQEVAELRVGKFAQLFSTHAELSPTRRPGAQNGQRVMAQSRLPCRELHG